MEITKVKLEKGRSHQKYVGATGETYPGVTTILGIMAKPQLLHWAWSEGVAGRDYKKTSGHAADIGTIAHFMCECYVKGDEPDLTDFPADQVTIATIAFEKFKAYWNENGFKLVASEVQLARDDARYGGTLDLVVEDKAGRLTLIDLKTSKGIYTEYIAQLEAYSELWAVCKGSPITRKIIVRIGKEKDGDFEVKEYGDLSKYWALFQSCIAVYYAKKAIE